ncbi:P-loop containing nucleoside triphosphate hydrolase protein [Geopyxis carbonaria]|nr:P-loop containing nucleoside triphosphate hydrolase protein [Geopyxis carbonaria]
MQAQIDSLIESTATRFTSVPENERLLISVSGIPGSGKTTLASRVVKGLNEKLGSEVAAMIPMDGYHLTRQQLSAMPDPELAHFCRGAHWTFAPQILGALIFACKLPISKSGAQTIHAASFDHAMKDPVEDDIPILPTHRILVFEGNYLALSEPKDWADVAEQFDIRWFVEVDENVAKERLAKRHVKAGIVQTYEEGVDRAERNDLVNGKFLMEHMMVVDRKLQSIDDESFKS